MAGDRVVQLDMFSGDQNAVAGAVSATFLSPVPVAAVPAVPVTPVLGVVLAEKPVVAPFVPAASVSRVIQDAGEELTYNRRNRNKSAKVWADVEHLNDALKTKEMVKSNIWPKPDFQKLIDDGMMPVVAHIFKQVYDSVAAKPVVGRGVLDDVGFQRYVKALNRVEKGLNEWSRDRGALQQWFASNVRVVGAMLGKQVSLGDLASAPKSLLTAVFPGGWRADKDELMIAGGNKLLSALQPSLDECKKAMKAIDEGWPKKREAWEVQGYRVVENPEVVVEMLPRSQGWFLMVDGKYVKSFESVVEAEGAKAAVKPFVLFGKRGIVGSFELEDEAVEAAKNLTRRDKTKQVGEKGVLVSAVERTGVARRMEGEDISAERLVAEFGLKGVNFGTWMKNSASRAEAQLHLNHAFDSFHDLAEIMGVPPKAISLNGMLGLAIGAQGSGGFAAAHFVPGVNEINLTRTSGAGSLAHEWAHALDHYFAAQGKMSTADMPYLSEHAGLSFVKTERQRRDDGFLGDVSVPRFGDLRAEVVGAFNVIQGSMQKRLETPEDVKLRLEARLDKGNKEVGNFLRVMRRDFSTHVDAFDALAAKVQAGDVGDGMVAIGRNTYVSPVVAEIRDLYKVQHGRVGSVENIKGLQWWVNSAKFQVAKLASDSVAPLNVNTDYVKNALALDKEKGGKPYWSTTRELFARAFDAFVSDELDAKSAKNGYLSHGVSEGDTVPKGDEREAVNAAFRGLVGDLLVRDTERGSLLFSAGVDNGERGSMPLAEIEAEISRLRGEWKSMPPVSVVRSVSDLPYKMSSRTDGAYGDGRVYVVADNIADLKQLQKVMAHECVMHHSVVEMLGDYGFSKLHHGIQKLKKDGDPVIGAIAADILSRYGVLPPEIESKEIVARAGEQCLDDSGNLKVAFGFMKGVFAGVAGWLRDHGISVPFTNTELQGIMHNAGEWVKKDLSDSWFERNEVRVDGLVLNSFAGIQAETAPLSALKVAREMFISGVDDRDIWRDTGWTFAFADGKPRFEISDDLAAVVVENRSVFQIWKDMEKVDPKVNNVGQFMLKHPDSPLSSEISNHQGVRTAYSDMKTNAPSIAREIENYLEHESLFKAYPSLAKIKAGQPDGLEGLVNAGAAAFIPDANLIKYSRVNNPDQFKSTTLHELQHAIQEIEGFSPGGSPLLFKDLDLTDKELSRINKVVHSLYENNRDFYSDVVKATQLQIRVEDKYGVVSQCSESDPLVQEWWAAIDKRDAYPDSNEWYALKGLERQVARDRVILSPMDQYKRLAGETEARLTQARIDMSPAERVAGYPLDDMDLAVPGQVVMSAGKVAGLVGEGFHVGLVLDVAGGVATQRVNRDGGTVRHAVSLLSAPVAIGSVVEITYKDGVGVVGGKGVSVGVGR